MRAILKQVELSPAEERRWLAEKLVATLEHAAAPMPQTPVNQNEGGHSFAELRGIANRSGRSSSDEEVDEMRYEALKEKHLK